MKKTINLTRALVLLAFLCIYSTVQAAPTRYYYQIRIYHLKTKAQEDRLDNYLKNA